MALIRCPDCARDVSDAARSCPHCGFPIAKRRVPSPPTDPNELDEEDDRHSTPRARRHLPHSGPGIASFAVALVAGLMIVAMMTGSIALVAAHGGKPRDIPRHLTMLIGFIGLGGVVLALFGAVLAVSGLVIPDRKKVFAMLGLIFNSVIVLGFLLLMVIGLLNQR
jgi:hypothetical protein